MIFSDIHSNIEAFEKLLSLKKIGHADKYLFLGDLVGYGPNPDEVVSQFRKLPRVNFVRGNHDK
ncbi:MAG: metallophosphoesterase family protein, partial [Candidatus Aminicenantes bacterium]|nr:metallophosphoesterase family protein [Candidatus Aminicenantes bacterium]